MTYATLMVNLELGRSNASLLKVAGDLAERFHASVIGIAARQPAQIMYTDAYIVQDLVEEDRREIESEIKAAEAEFRDALQTRTANLAWRSTVGFTPPSDYLASEARSADLVVTGMDREGTLTNPSRSANIGDFVMRVGRPVLIVPATMDKLTLDRVVVGWKETRETRRATADALPLLKQAGQVTIVEITPLGRGDSGPRAPCGCRRLARAARHRGNVLRIPLGRQRRGPACGHRRGTGRQRHRRGRLWA